MRTILFTLLAIRVAETRLNRSTREDGFDKKLKKGYEFLKNERNSENTMRFLEKLHNMEKEMEVDLLLPAKQNSGLLKKIKKYNPVKKDHIQPMGDTIAEINQKSEVDTALFQGDMLLTGEQTEEMMEGIIEHKGNRNKRQAYLDEHYPKTLWTNGVHYSFYSNSTRDRIMLINANGCWSNLGRIGGMQQLSLGSGCESVGTAAHEIGHALGLFHTQSRHDRDSFVALDTQNFLPGWLSQFTKQSERINYNYNLTYDYGSVMHYGATSVSKNDRPVMIPYDVRYTQTIGSPIISFYDKLMVNLHYKCLDKCIARSSAKCENGGFPHPRDCSKCSCPSGYGGKLCNKKPDGCGKILTATTLFQTLEDRVGGKNISDDFAMCNYWILAPTGLTIEVVLASYTNGVATDGCEYAGVEIKTGQDKRHTGYRFCSPENVGTSLISTHNIVPIVTYGRIQEVKTVLRYRIQAKDSRRKEEWMEVDREEEGMEVDGEEPMEH